MKQWKKILPLFLTLVLCLGLAACGGGEPAEDETDTKAEEVCYPVSIGDTEIRVGETTVQALLDAGLKVTVSDENYNSVEIDPETMLEANAYYSGGTVWISDHVFAHISMATEEAVPMGDAVVARLEFQMYSEEDPAVLETLAFNGVPVPELTHDKAVEMLPDFTGDEVMWLKKTLEYDYLLGFDSQTGELKQFSAAKTYDVDWSSGDEAAS